MSAAMPVPFAADLTRRRVARRLGTACETVSKGSVSAALSRVRKGPGGSNRLRQGYGGPPKLHAKAEDPHYGCLLRPPGWVPAMKASLTVAGVSAG
jgi:hypothetical protein